MVDCSHGNSGKDYTKQKDVLEYCGNLLMNDISIIMGFMIESNLKEGNQKLVMGESDKLEWGVSVTDSCVNIEQTDKMIKNLYDKLFKNINNK